MRVGIISVFTDYHRRGRHHRGVLQPQIGPLIAALLPARVEIDVVNDTWEDPDWSRDYNLVFLSALHSDFDRARQLSHYYRRRGAKTPSVRRPCGVHARPGSANRAVSAARPQP